MDKVTNLADVPQGLWTWRHFIRLMWWFVVHADIPDYSLLCVYVLIIIISCDFYLI